MAGGSGVGAESCVGGKGWWVVREGVGVGVAVGVGVGVAVRNIHAYKSIIISINFLLTCISRRSLPAAPWRAAR